MDTSLAPSLAVNFPSAESPSGCPPSPTPLAPQRRAAGRWNVGGSRRGTAAASLLFAYVQLTPPPPPRRGLVIFSVSKGRDEEMGNGDAGSRVPSSEAPQEACSERRLPPCLIMAAIRPRRL